MPWLDSRGESPARAAVLLPLAAASGIYGAGARLHRALYRSGALRAVRLSGRVVSVGNLVVGGTGKTPTAAWIAAALHRRGWKVALASRGYRRGPLRSGAGSAPGWLLGLRRRERVHVVSDGRFVLGRVELAGDEPMWLAARVPGVPVLVGDDRALVGLRALSAFGTEVLVLDDGFHHHRLHRDVDLVTFDGALGFGNRRVLPRGPLREPIGALRHADAVGVIDGPLDPADAALLDRFAPHAHRFSARRAPTGLRPLAGGEERAPEALAGARVGLLCALARPASLRRTVEELGGRVVAERTFRDHHRYRERDLRGLEREAPLWVTTEKDAVKMLPRWAGGAKVWVLSIELEVTRSEAFVDWIEARLR